MRGKVSLESCKGWLRLRWRYEGKRYSLALGLPDSKSNRLKSQSLILQIDADLETGSFDPSLAKYKQQPKQQQQPLRHSLICSQLFDQWLNSKIGISKRTLDWHRDSLVKLIAVCGDLQAGDIGEAEVRRFFLSLTNLTKTTQRRRIETLKACWQWGISQGLLEQNPWTKLPSIKPENPNPEPFAKEEIGKILATLEKEYPELLPLTKFLLGTGCRIGEALALRWDDVSQDFRKALINKQLTRGEIKPPKSEKKREIYLSDNVVNLLKELKPITSFVFHDGTITDEYISNRWKRALKLAGVRYRSPYNCRHTFISHCLEAGMNPVRIAAITGHDVKVLLSHYAGLIDKPIIPELF